MQPSTMYANNAMMSENDTNEYMQNSINNNATTTTATIADTMLTSSSQSALRIVNSATSSSSSYTNFSDKELHDIRQIALSENCFPLLVASLCPDIYGHEIVKAGLLFGILGGTPNAVSETTIPVRSDIHVLVVGDPGMGKSQLLRATAKMCNRSVHVTAHSMSIAGLTAAVGRESRANGGDMVIEAGALVLADRGVCCIDELDKIDCDYHALLEAMEQQSISIAKSGVVTTLKSRASVLAAANPVNGHYNKTKTIQENLKMPAALLSRFDLVYILIDRPEEGTDKLMTEHIMMSHLSADAVRHQHLVQQQQLSMNNRFGSYINNSSSNSNKGMNTQSEYTASDEGTRTLAQQLRRDVLSINNNINNNINNHTQSLHKRARVDDDWNALDIHSTTKSHSHTHNNINSNSNSSNNRQNSLIPIDLFRKYIEYAKQYVHPHLTRPAAKVLQVSYLLYIILRILVY